MLSGSTYKNNKASSIVKDGKILKDTTYHLSPHTYLRICNFYTPATCLNRALEQVDRDVPHPQSGLQPGE